MFGLPLKRLLFKSKLVFDLKVYPSAQPVHEILARIASHSEGSKGPVHTHSIRFTHLMDVEVASDVYQKI